MSCAESHSELAQKCTMVRYTTWQQARRNRQHCHVKSTSVVDSSHQWPRNPSIQACSTSGQPIAHQLGRSMQAAQRSQQCPALRTLCCSCTEMQLLLCLVRTKDLQPPLPAFTAKLRQEQGCCCYRVMVALVAQIAMPAAQAHGSAVHDEMQWNSSCGCCRTCKHTSSGTRTVRHHVCNGHRTQKDEAHVQSQCFLRSGYKVLSV
jgi:hypothetical protein